MTEFIIYQGKTAIVLAVFYMFYRLLLSKDTFHRFNRIVLLGTAALSSVLPCCVITIHKVVTLPAANPMPQALEGVASGTIATASEASGPIWLYLACAVFVLGALGVLAMSGLSIYRVMSIVRQGEHRTLESGERLVITDTDTAPFSWMKYIVLSREDFEGSCGQILIHEKAHIALRHSWDIIFVDLLTALQWFNPAIWMLKADLRAIHEFEADEAVLRSGTDVKEYQYLLIRKAVSKSGYSVANSLNHSTLKQRITMMSNKRSSRMSALKALYIVPLVGLSLAATAETKVDYQYEAQLPEAVADTLVDKGSENWHKVGSGEPTSFRKKNLHNGKFITDFENNTLTLIFYDTEEKECRVQYKGLALNKDIYIYNGAYVNKEIFDMAAADDPEAVIMVAYLKEGKQVRAVVTPSEVYVTGTIEIHDDRHVQVDKKEVLIVVDGTPMPEGFSIEEIEASSIASITVVKDKDIFEKYGKLAENKNGVIEITTKPLRFIPVSEAVGNLEEYAGFMLYDAEGYPKSISYADYKRIPEDAHAYHYVEHKDGKKYLHVYTVDYNVIVRLSKGSKTTDINDEALSWVDEKTQILVDGKWHNLEGYLRALEYQGDRIAEIEYYKYPERKAKRHTGNGFVSVIFKKENAKEIRFDIF